MRHLNRLRAAWRAFKDPLLVHDGAFLQDLVEQLYRRDGAALITGDLLGDTVRPRIEMLPHGAREALWRLK